MSGEGKGFTVPKYSLHRLFKSGISQNKKGETPSLHTAMTYNDQQLFYFGSPHTQTSENKKSYHYL